MTQMKRAIRKQARKVLNRYARPSRSNSKNLRRVRPLLTAWFAIVDRVR